MESAKPARYDEFARWYDDWVAAPEDDLVAESLFRLVGDVSEQRILDLGCGQGRIARELARRGNDVVGVDLSTELLQIASEQKRITYVHGDACTTDWWDGVTFDGVVSNMALMDIDDLGGAVSTAAATLRPGGWFAWSIIHPAFPGIDEIRPSWPDEGYFQEGWWNTGGDGVRGRVGSNHRTLSTYFNTMLNYGFVLESTAEPAWRLSASVPPMPFFLVTRWCRR